MTIEELQTLLESDDYFPGYAYGLPELVFPYLQDGYVLGDGENFKNAKHDFEVYKGDAVQGFILAASFNEEGDEDGEYWYPEPPNLPKHPQ